MNRHQYNPWLHRIALITTAATFPLIFLGGMVTSKHAGLSVPDWPTSFGYNMFALPWSYWVGGIVFEHTHRLLASVVGMLSILLATWAWFVEPRAWVRRLAYGVLAGVIFQGVLGGLRVRYVNLDLAIIHACFAQAFFCLASLVSIATSQWWLAVENSPIGNEFRCSRPLITLGVVCVVVIYSQLVIGATMRHFDAGLAIPDLPLAYGHLLPPGNSAELAAVNVHRAFDLSLQPVTLSQIWLHFGHRVGAVVVSALIVFFSSAFFISHARRRVLTIPAGTLLALLLAQITLGVLTVLKRKPADIASLHVATGALVLVTAFQLTVRSMKLYATAHRAAPAKAHVPDNCERMMSDQMVAA